MSTNPLENPLPNPSRSLLHHLENHEDGDDDDLDSKIDSGLGRQESGGNFHRFNSAPSQVIDMELQTELEMRTQEMLRLIEEDDMKLRQWMQRRHFPVNPTVPPREDEDSESESGDEDLPFPAPLTREESTEVRLKSKMREKIAYENARHAFLDGELQALRGTLEEGATRLDDDLLLLHMVEARIAGTDLTSLLADKEETRWADICQLDSVELRWVRLLLVETIENHPKYKEYADRNRDQMQRFQNWQRRLRNLEIYHLHTREREELDIPELVSRLNEAFDTNDLAEEDLVPFYRARVTDYQAMADREKQAFQHELQEMWNRVVA
jgi:hypothetical protein